jgi:hypothetical protein
MHPRLLNTGAHARTLLSINVIPQGVTLLVGINSGE